MHRPSSSPTGGHRLAQCPRGYDVRCYFLGLQWPLYTRSTYRTPGFIPVSILVISWAGETFSLPLPTAGDLPSGVYSWHGIAAAFSITTGGPETLFNVLDPFNVSEGTVQGRPLWREFTLNPPALQLP